MNRLDYIFIVFYLRYFFLYFIAELLFDSSRKLIDKLFDYPTIVIKVIFQSKILNVRSSNFSDVRFPDVSLGTWETVMKMFYSFLTFYEPINKSI